MKILIVISILLIFIGCGDKKNKVTTELESDTISIHNAESDVNSSKERFIYSENINFKLTDEIRITESLDGNYSSPMFSPDGKKLLFTNSDYSEIWMYDISQKEIQQVSTLPGSGYKFSISNDGSKIYFRNKAARSRNQSGISSIIEQELATKNHNIIYTSEFGLSPPIVFPELLFFLENEIMKCFDLTAKGFIGDSNLPLIFIKENILYKYKYGRVFNLNETRNDYVNLDYSIDRNYISGLTKKNGVEVFDNEGNLIKTFREAVSLNILQNSNLVIFNKETDDGLSIKKSDLFLGFLNSDNVIKIENTSNEKRFQPSWSPTENMIAYTNENGVIKIVSFNIEKN